MGGGIGTLQEARTKLSGSSMSSSIIGAAAVAGSGSAFKNYIQHTQ